MHCLLICCLLAVEVIFLSWQCTMAWFVDLVVRFVDLIGASFIVVGTVLTAMSFMALDDLGNNIIGVILTLFGVMLLVVWLTVDTGM